MVNDNIFSRYIPDRVFPPYRFIPGGDYPHPEKEGGYLFGKENVSFRLIQETNPEQNKDYLYALDLFNAGYYWEAHVWFEGLWNAHSRMGKIADFLKGLIKLCAAGVKMEMNQVVVGKKHLERAKELLEDKLDGYLGINGKALQYLWEEESGSYQEWVLLFNREIISLGGGCFWGIEYALKQLSGIESVTCGYQGGTTKHPSYLDVCSGETSHVEVVCVVFNPGKLSLQRLLQAFFTIHDPTQADGQGPDRGPQYRSAVFCQNRRQLEFVQQFVSKEKQKYGQRLTTEIKIDKTFYRAEKEHQNYLERNPQGYCHISFEVFEKIRSGNF